MFIWYEWRFNGSMGWQKREHLNRKPSIFPWFLWDFPVIVPGKTNQLTLVIKHGWLEHPRSLNGGFDRWEHHLFLWSIFQHAIFDYWKIMSFMSCFHVFMQSISYGMRWYEMMSNYRVVSSNKSSILFNRFRIDSLYLSRNWAIRTWLCLLSHPVNITCHSNVRKWRFDPLPWKYHKIPVAVGV